MKKPNIGLSDSHLATQDMQKCWERITRKGVVGILSVDERLQHQAKILYPDNLVLQRIASIPPDMRTAEDISLFLAELQK